MALAKILIRCFLKHFFFSISELKPDLVWPGTDPFFLRNDTCNGFIFIKKDQETERNSYAEKITKIFYAKQKKKNKKLQSRVVRIMCNIYRRPWQRFRTKSSGRFRGWFRKWSWTHSYCFASKIDLLLSSGIRVYLFECYFLYIIRIEIVFNNNHKW